MADTPFSGSMKIRMIECDDSEPRVRLAAGKRFEVVATTVVDTDLNQIADDEAANARPARLCGSRSTCVAIVEIE